MTQASRFHLAFPVHDLALARHFYGTVLGCPEGRSASDWVDFDLFGHQIVAHLAPNECQGSATNPVDGDLVPVRHFGLILNMDDWRQLADHLDRQSITFLIRPHVRFAGETGEQATFFVRDPSGNALEFKAFADIGQLFAR